MFYVRYLRNELFRRRTRTIVTLLGLGNRRRARHRPRQPVERPQSRRARARLLEEVGLLDRADHLPAHLSGGEQQRVAIARALSVEPRVILADEPTGNLDTKTGADVIDVLSGLAAEHGATIVVATHDAELAQRAPRRLAVRDGKLAAPVFG